MSTPITEALHRLGQMEREVNDYEAGCLESLLRRHSYTPNSYTPNSYTPKHKAVVATMVDAYVQESTLAAEILGQQRLWS